MDLDTGLRALEAIPPEVLQDVEASAFWCFWRLLESIQVRRGEAVRLRQECKPAIQPVIIWSLWHRLPRTVLFGPVLRMARRVLGLTIFLRALVSKVVGEPTPQPRRDYGCARSNFHAPSFSDSLNRP